MTRVSCKSVRRVVETGNITVKTYGSLHLQGTWILTVPSQTCLTEWSIGLSDMEDIAMEVAVTQNSWDDRMTVMQRNVVMRWRTWYVHKYGQPGNDTSPEIGAERSWIGLWMWCGTPE